MKFQEQIAVSCCGHAEKLQLDTSKFKYGALFIDECNPKSKNFLKFEANRFFNPLLSVNNEDLKNRLNEEVGEIGLIGVRSLMRF